MKSTLQPQNEIEAYAEDAAGPFARIRIREPRGGTVEKCSIFLTPDQLDEHARTCTALAEALRSRQRP